MEEALPSLSSGPVGSRFVSQNDIDSAKERRDEQWKAAYARLGQEPPPQPVEDSYDGRSLAEKLAANKAAKQEEWEEKTKLANQFRALEEDEVLFLDSLRNEEEKKELKRKLEDAEEVKGFQQAVTARNALPDKPPTSTAASGPSTSSGKSKLSQTPKSTGKKTSSVKNALKGVVVKKKLGNGKTIASATPPRTSVKAADAEKVKRQRVSSPES
ncbi:N-terminal domain of NEFA-interacting nuclear protein NIP30-domain-containing protein [Phellopilus nigrolimitatus]|nr:N-terminal domain of NEFA-interacting nuclear protein NIP30-domain-containing protein [Phellopilus nigrolimitatus]